MPPIPDGYASDASYDYGVGSGEDVIANIKSGGQERFIEYLKDPNYGPEYFTNMVDNWTPPEDYNRITIFGQEGIMSYANYGRKLQRWGHTNFPGEEYSDLRHMVSSFIFAEKHGGLAARAFGFGNEGIGLYFDIRAYMRGQQNDAFQWGDLWNNEKGFWQSFWK